MVEQLRKYVDALLTNYIKALDVQLPQSEEAWLLNDIVSQVDLAAHNMIREALSGLGHDGVKDGRTKRGDKVRQKGS